MSFDALAWAVKCQPGSAADKLVLLGLADRHNSEHGVAYPSLAWLTEFSGLYRKTVIAALDRLIEKGLIEDTGQRVGKTKQVKVYALKIEQSQKAHPSNSVLFHGKQCAKAHSDTIKEPRTKRAKALSVARTILETDLDIDASVDWAVNEMGWHRQDALAEWQRFVDNSHAHGRRYKDWLAAWRNWCRSPYCKTVARAKVAMFI